MNIIIFCLLSLSFSAETNDYQKYDDPGDCICDVTAESCDEFCCCDPDCLSSFDSSDCAAERYSTYGEKYCADSSQVFRVNKRRGMKTTSGRSSEKCVKIDNSAKIEGFHSIVSSVSSSKVSDRIKDSSTYDDLFVLNVPVKSSKYEVGDAVSGITASFPDPTGNCVESQVGFMIDYNGTCVRSGLLSDICLNYLSINSDYDSITLTKINYSTDREISVDSNVQTSYSSNTCKNAVLKTTLAVGVSSSLTSISSAATRVHYVITDLTSSSSMSISQSTNIKFVSSSSFSETSGNPGYLKSRPLKIKVDSKSTYLYLRGKSSSGECSSSTSTSDGSVFSNSPVNFGSDLVYTCSLSKTYDSLKSYCSSSLDVTSTEIFKSILDIGQIGKWGVSESGTSDDWVSVSTSSPATPSFASGTCELSSILVLNVYYTSIGSFSNPQSKVVYSTRSFKTQPWKFTNKDRTKPQTFFYSAVVNFIPYNSDSDPYYSPKRVDSIMPQNVLDPVRTTSFSLFLGFSFYFIFN